MLSDGASYITQSRRSLTSYAKKNKNADDLNSANYGKYMMLHLKARDGDLLLITDPCFPERCTDRDSGAAASHHVLQRLRDRLAGVPSSDDHAVLLALDQLGLAALQEAFGAPRLGLPEETHTDHQALHTHALKGTLHFF